VDLWLGLDESSDEASGNGSASFADVETLTRFNGDWVVEHTFHFNVVAWHDHPVFLLAFTAFWPVNCCGFVYVHSELVKESLTEGSKERNRTHQPFASKPVAYSYCGNQCGDRPRPW
jgi:hypothetical protein